MKHILLVAGTRPNFIKLAPLYHRLRVSEGFQLFICHTGQHFDFNMSDIFWQNLDLPRPDFELNIRGEGVVDTIGKTIIGINEVINKNKFDLVIVFGDVNATAAAAIVGAQSGIKVMHVEAGLRSFDRSMPEEVNRIITDHVSDYLMVSEQSGVDNLAKEGFPANKIFYVGNIMIESLMQTRQKWENILLSETLRTVYDAKPIIATFHRPENVDTKNELSRVVDIIYSLATTNPVVFPVHPRTKSKLEEFFLIDKLVKNENILLTDPLGYFHFLKLVSNSSLVITDSGGIQEETTYLKIPCITLRKNTERPITVTEGTNLLASINDIGIYDRILQHKNDVKSKNIVGVKYWDSNVSQRIVEIINQ